MLWSSWVGSFCDSGGLHRPANCLFFGVMAATQIAGAHKVTGSYNLRDAYRSVADRVGEAAVRSGRRASDVLVVAVTKTATPDQIRSLLAMGHADLGEGRVQQLSQRVALIEEFLSRKRALPGGSSKSTSAMGEDVPKLRWHMVGHLQRNKVKQVAPLVQLIHSVDSLRLAEEIHAYAARADRVVDILIQVNASGEANKFGVASPAVVHLAEQIDTMMHLRLRGLMAMAPRCAQPEDARPTFAHAAELFHEMRTANVGGPDCNILSMGMSDDFEVAIEEGANIVRLGRAIFGEADPR